MAETFNDNAPHTLGPKHGPDAHGHAALLLVESLIHGLIAVSALSIVHAVEALEVAIDVNTEMVAVEKDCPDSLRQSLAILQALSTSLTRDLPRR